MLLTGGYCAKEQPLGERCVMCGKRLAGSAAGAGTGSRFWEVRCRAVSQSFVTSVLLAAGCKWMRWMCIPSCDASTSLCPLHRAAKAVETRRCAEFSACCCSAILHSGVQPSPLC